MATKTATDLKVEIDLDSLRSMLDDLPGLAQEWDHLGDGERVSWSRDRDQSIGALEVVLQPRYCSGAMTPDQQGRYQAMLQQFEAAAPTLERLGLYLPPMPLEA